MLITGPTECGKSVFPTNITLHIFIDFGKIYIFPLSIHQDLYEKLVKCFSNYMPVNKISNNLNEDDLELVIDEIVNDKNFGNSKSEKKNI